MSAEAPKVAVPKVAADVPIGGGRSSGRNTFLPFLVPLALDEQPPAKPFRRFAAPALGTAPATSEALSP